MVKIRYAELPAGLHVATEDHGTCTVVYLLPGLTPAQRRAALTFARRAARMGHGPSLPPVDMALALGADTARTTARALLAALRRHPVLLVPLVAGVSGMIVATMLSFVTVTVSPVGTTDSAPHSGGKSAPAASRCAVPRPGVSREGNSGSAANPAPSAVPAQVARSGSVPAPPAMPDTSSPWCASKHSAVGHVCLTLGRTRVCIGS